MANQLYMPNIVQSFNQGVARGKQNRLAKLAGQAYTTPPDQRNALLGQIASINPQFAAREAATFQAQERRQAQEQKAAEVDHNKKLRGAAEFSIAALKSGDPARIQGASDAVGPYLTELTGKEFPGLSEDMLPILYRIIAQTGGEDATKGVVVSSGSSLVNPVTGEPLYQAPAQLPTGVRELEYLKAHPELAQFDQQRRMASRPVTNINTGRQENAFQTAVGKADAGEYVKWRDNAIQANNTLAQANQIEQILNAQETGKVQEALALAGQYFGTDAGSSLQAMKAAIQPLVLSNVKQLGSGTGISDADRKFIEAGMPGFGNTPKANARVLRIMRMVAKRKIDLFNQADKYVKQHGSLQGFASPYISGSPAPTSDDGWSIQEVQ